MRWQHDSDHRAGDSADAAGERVDVAAAKGGTAMNDEFNPLGREYSKAEVAAGIRVGLARRGKKFAPYPDVIKVISGPMIYGTGDVLVRDARQMAKDWTLVADAMEREFRKGGRI